MQDFKRDVCLEPGGVEGLQQGDVTCPLASGCDCDTGRGPGWQEAVGKAALGCQGDARTHRKHTVRVRAVRQSRPCSAFTFRASGRGEVSRGAGRGGVRIRRTTRPWRECRNGSHAS